MIQVDLVSQKAQTPSMAHFHQRFNYKFIY